MGTFSVTIEVGDVTGTRWQPVEMLVDSGATYTWVPGSLLRGLGVEPQAQLPFEIANGATIDRGVAETRVRYQGRSAHTFVVFGDEGSTALLGAYTLEGFLLAADPYHRRLVPIRAFAMKGSRQVIHDGRD